MLDPLKLFETIPPGLRDPLVAAYVEIANNYAERRWEPSELNGGKLCEVVYSIVHGTVVGPYPASPHKPPNMVDACHALEQVPANPTRAGDRSLRILIPRLLPYLYEIRNNRGVGHVGGDVNPNLIDATAVFSCSSWLMAELVRIFHGVDLYEAQVTVEALVEKKHPIVWEVEGVKRVLDPEMAKGDQALTLLYSSNGWISEDRLRAWVEYKNKTQFRDLVLSPLHKTRFIEYDATQQRVRITPRGLKNVEDQLLAKHGP